MIQFDSIYTEYFARLLMSLGCGILLGVERKIRNNAVGIRTLVLISVSSCLLSILSVHVGLENPGRTDCSRIAAGVVTGIGFLGGGAIFRQGLNIRGLTTAGIIWTSSALGLSCGAGLYFPTIVTLIIVLIMLPVMNVIEHKMFPNDRTKLLSLEFDSVKIKEDEIKAILLSYDLIIYDMDLIHSVKKEKLELVYSIKAPEKLDSIKLASELATLGNLTKFSLSD